MNPTKPRIDIVVAIHGIMTGRSEPTWPERLEIRLAQTQPQARVLTDHYNAGPTPRLNWFLFNPMQGDSIADWVAHWHTQTPDARVFFVAHSNGCDIARRAMIELDRQHSIKTQTAVLVSAPLPETTKGIGLRPLLDNGSLQRLICYVGSRDSVLGAAPTISRPWRYLGRIARWPYGNLGQQGLRDADETLEGNAGTPTAKAVNRVFADWGHCDFFPLGNTDRIAETFGTIERDLYAP